MTLGGGGGGGRMTTEGPGGEHVEDVTKGGADGILKSPDEWGARITWRSSEDVVDTPDILGN